MSQDVSDRIPLYRSHKLVRAAPIVGYKDDPFGDGEGTQNDEPYVILDLGSDDRLFMPVPQNFFGRGVPAPNDMFVLYADGYKSWSPRKVFDDGYSRHNPLTADHVAEFSARMAARDEDRRWGSLVRRLFGRRLRD